MLARLLLSELPAEASDWLRKLLQARDLASLRAGFAEAPTVVGVEKWIPGPEARALLEDNRLEWPCRASVDEIVRVVILTRAASRSSHPEVLVGQWYAAGEADAKRAVLRALSLLTRPKQHRPLALRAARSAEPRVFEAIACDNPYPAMYFDDGAFEAMLDRLMRLGLKPERVLDVGGRMSALGCDGVLPTERVPWRTPPSGIQRLFHHGGGPFDGEPLEATTPAKAQNEE